MSRLVIPKTVGRGQLATEDVDRLPKDEYKDRLVKYIPAESVAFYTFVDKFLNAYYGIDADGNATKNLADAGLIPFLSWLFVILGLVGTPLYLYKQRKDKQPWGLHAFLSTLAFPFWSYTLAGTLFLTHHWYKAILAAVAAPVFTFVAGILEPKPGKSNANPNGEPAPPNSNVNPNPAPAAEADASAKPKVTS
jgi:hypothetical protein